MTIRVSLFHQTIYEYGEPATLGPHTVRLRPAAHCRTPIKSYTLVTEPQAHFLNWLQDPFGNFEARYNFHEPTRQLSFTVDLTAEMTVINPFDFFIEESAEEFPFLYSDELQQDLKPYLAIREAGPKLMQYLETFDKTPRRTISFLVETNQKVQQDIQYLIRMEPGVQTCEDSLERKSGSCRDSAWLLMQVLRHFGFATRFVSGYLIQLAPDLKSLDGPSGPEQDFTDLHAWTEVFIPGAGWIGLDATSGLLASEGHIPLACSPLPTSAAPIDGTSSHAATGFHHTMKVTRVHEDPRVTKPYTEPQWERILALGDRVDEVLQNNDVRLTMGGEPTFVSIDDMEGDEWNTAAVGPAKKRLSEEMLGRLEQRFANGALLHFGQGKWYPGEPLPRWAMTCLWRKDGEPIWQNHDLVGAEDQAHKTTVDEAAQFVEVLCDHLSVESKWIKPAYEDVWNVINEEQKLPVNVNPKDFDLDKAEERARLARALERGVTEPVGFVLPLKRAWWQADAKWASGPWPFRSPKLFLIPGDSPIGLRLPLDNLPAKRHPDDPRPDIYEVDPFEPRRQLPRYVELRHAAQQAALEMQSTRTQFQKPGEQRDWEREAATTAPATGPDTVVRTAMCVEPRDGVLHVFMPPTETLEDYLDLTTAIEATAEDLELPVVLEGYLPPHDDRVEVIKVTPDPGVIEVNVQPAKDWRELVDITTGIYEEARLCRLGTEKFQLDGRHAGTGGGNHVVMGGPTPADSPFLRRPDLLGSLIAYWNNHPSLSYLFSGLFVGPTSQAPRIDEGRRDAVYELQIALDLLKDMQNAPASEKGDRHPTSNNLCERNPQMPGASPLFQPPPPWLVDRLFRHLAVDLTGNTHRAEFCIDKLYSPDSASGRLGLVEFRSFEMPPHSQMSLTQQLLLRSLIALFWQKPYQRRVIDWDTQLHDRFMLPHFLMSDFRDVVSDLNEFGFDLDYEWFLPHIDFRCPPLGDVEYDGFRLELRQAIEPWYVLGEEPAGGGMTRFVDSSCERLEVKISGGIPDRYIVTCNERKVPLSPSDVQGEFVGGVRFRAWQPPSCLHPTIPMHVPLVFDIVDTWRNRSIGGCKYHIENEGGLNPPTFPVNALEAESRRACRFFRFGHTPGEVSVVDEQPDPHYPMTLDLRRGVRK